MINMSLKSRNIIAVLVGVLGAVIAGAWVYAVNSFLEVYSPLNTVGITLPAGIISGFLSCFFMYQLYSRLVKPEYFNSQAAFYRAIFGGLAGVLSGVITGIAYLFSYTEVPHVWEEFVGCGLFGALLGGLTGVVATLTFDLVFGRFTKG